MKVIYNYKGYSIIKENSNEKYPWNIYENFKDSEKIRSYVDREKTLKNAMEKIDEDFYVNNMNNAQSLSEYFDKYHDEYCWESTLEEDLIEDDWNNPSNNPDSRDYKVGDIVMVNSEVEGTHRILIISTITRRGKDTVYRGYLLSSKVNKANINNEKFPNNIYIKDYSTILKRGNKINKEAIIVVDSLKEFDKSSFSSSGTYKGTVTDEFLDFIKTCANNYRNGIDNRNMMWEG